MGMQTSKTYIISFTAQTAIDETYLDDHVDLVGLSSYKGTFQQC